MVWHFLVLQYGLVHSELCLKNTIVSKRKFNLQHDIISLKEPSKAKKGLASVTIWVSRQHVRPSFRGSKILQTTYHKHLFTQVAAVTLGQPAYTFRHVGVLLTKSFTWCLTIQCFNLLKYKKHQKAHAMLGSNSVWSYFQMCVTDSSLKIEVGESSPQVEIIYFHVCFL